MQLDTVLKVGSLAFSVARDDNIRELVSIVHKGAKRRGLIGAPMGVQAMGAPQPQTQGRPPVKTNEHPIPFAPGKSTSSNIQAQSSGGTDWNQLLNGANAKKLLGVAGQIGQMLIK